MVVRGGPRGPGWLRAGRLLRQDVIEEERELGHKKRPEPTGDFSSMLPEGDPIRRELESLFPPYLHIDGTPRDPSTGALPGDENFLSAHPDLSTR